MPKVTFSLDDDTVTLLRRVAERKHKAQSLVVREAIVEYAGREDKLSDAELFHPDTNTWTPTGSLQTARQRASAARLKNGVVVVAGGELADASASAVEVYDPATGRFERPAGLFAAARTGHAMVALEDGRVLIAGGYENQRVVDYIDVYDPEHGTFPAGRMSEPRANFAAVSLSDGRVLFAGGSDGTRDLASAELYDPATGNITITEPMASPRQAPMALNPRGQDRPLIAFGIPKDQPLASAEFFVPSQNAFVPAAELANGQRARRILTIGSIAPDGTVRSRKRFPIGK